MTSCLVTTEEVQHLSKVVNLTIDRVKPFIAQWMSENDTDRYPSDQEFQDFMNLKDTKGTTFYNDRAFREAMALFNSLPESISDNIRSLTTSDPEDIAAMKQALINFPPRVYRLTEHSDGKIEFKLVKPLETIKTKPIAIITKADILSTGDITEIDGEYFVPLDKADHFTSYVLAQHLQNSVRILHIPSPRMINGVSKDAYKVLITDDLLTQTENATEDQIQHIGKFLSSKFKGVVFGGENGFISEEEASKLLGIVPQALPKSFIRGGKIYFVKEKIHNDTLVISEALHPFTMALREGNKALFNNLLKEAKKSFSLLDSSVKTTMANTSKADQDLELVNQVLTRYLSAETRKRQPRTIRELAAKAINFIKNIFKTVFNLADVKGTLDIEPQMLSDTATYEDLAQLLNTSDTIFSGISERAATADRTVQGKTDLYIRRLTSTEINFAAETIRGEFGLFVNSMLGYQDTNKLEWDEKRRSQFKRIFGEAAKNIDIERFQKTNLQTMISDIAQDLNLTKAQVLEKMLSPSGSNYDYSITGIMQRFSQAAANISNEATRAQLMEAGENITFWSSAIYGNLNYRDLLIAVNSTFINNFGINILDKSFSTEVTKTDWEDAEGENDNSNEDTIRSNDSSEYLDFGAVDPNDTISAELKSFLTFVQDRVTVKNADGEYQEEVVRKYGAPIYLSQREVYNTLLERIAGSTTQEEIEEKLYNMTQNVPWMTALYNNINLPGNTGMKNTMLVALLKDRTQFTSTTDRTSTRHLSEEVSVKVTTSTRFIANEGNRIKKVKSAFLAQLYGLTSVGHMVYEDETGKRVVKNLKTKADAIINRITKINKSAYKSEWLDKDDFADLTSDETLMGMISDLYKEMGIVKSVRDIQDIFRKSASKSNSMYTNFCSVLDFLSDGTIAVTTKAGKINDTIYSALRKWANTASSTNPNFTKHKLITKFADWVARSVEDSTTDSYIYEQGKGYNTYNNYSAISLMFSQIGNMGKKSNSTTGPVWDEFARVVNKNWISSLTTVKTKNNQWAFRNPLLQSLFEDILNHRENPSDSCQVARAKFKLTNDVHNNGLKYADSGYLGDAIGTISAYFCSQTMRTKDGQELKTHSYAMPNYGDKGVQDFVMCDESFMCNPAKRLEPDSREEKAIQRMILGDLNEIASYLLSDKTGVSLPGLHEANSKETLADMNFASFPEVNEVLTKDSATAIYLNNYVLKASSSTQEEFTAWNNEVGRQMKAAAVEEIRTLLESKWADFIQAQVDELISYGVLDREDWGGGEFKYLAGIPQFHLEKGGTVTEDVAKGLLAEYISNQQFFNICIVQMASSTMNLYKDATKFLYRFSQQHTPGYAGLKGLTDELGHLFAPDGTLHVLYMKGFKVQLSQERADYLEAREQELLDNVTPKDSETSINDNWNYGDDYAGNALQLWDDKILRTEDQTRKKALINMRTALINALVKGYDVTDGQSITSLAGRRKEMGCLGRWNKLYEELYNSIINGTGDPSDLTTLFQTEKSGYCGFEKVTLNQEELAKLGNSYTKDYSLPVNHKHSEFLLMATMSLAAENNRRNNFLTQLSVLLNGKDLKGGKCDIDYIAFSEVVKTGGFGFVDVSKYIEKSGTDEPLDQSLEDYVSQEITKDPRILHHLDIDGYRIQQKVPQSVYEETRKMPTQYRKTIMEGLSGDHELNGKTYTSREFYMTFSQLVAANVKDSVAKAEVDLGIKDKDGNKLPDNYRKAILSKKVQNSMISSGRYESDMILAAGVEPGSVDGYPNVPLADPMTYDKTFSLVASYIKSAVTDQHVPGGAGVLATSVGLTDKCQIVFEKKRPGHPRKVKYIECMVSPRCAEWLAAVKQPDGTYDINAKNAAGERILSDAILEMIGVRIPTEKHYSMAPLKITGILDPREGSPIMLPSAIVFLSGCDYDVDKLYFMTRAYTRKRINLKALLPYFIEMEKRDMDITDEDSTIKIKDIEAWLGYVEGKISYDDLTEDQKYIDHLSKTYQGSDYTWLGDKSLGLREKTESPQWSSHLMTYDSIDAPAADTTVEEMTTAQRNNMMFDMGYEVLTNPNTVNSSLAFGNFERLKDLEKHFNKLKGRDKNKLILSHPVTMYKLHSYNTDAQSLIGTGANNNTSHAINEQYGCQVASFEFHPLLKMFGESLAALSFDQIRGQSGVDTSVYISETIAASVDNRKNPILGSLGLNPMTSDTFFFLVRAGFSTEQALTFIAQPIIEQLYALYEKESFTSSFPDLGSLILTLLKDMGLDEHDLSDRTQNLMKGLGCELFTIPKLEKLMTMGYEGDAELAQTKSDQLSVLAMFVLLNPSVLASGTLTLVTKSDSSANAVKKDYGETTNKLDRYDSFFETQKVFKWTGFAAGSPEPGVRYDPMISAFQQGNQHLFYATINGIYPWQTGDYDRAKYYMTKHGFNMNDEMINTLMRAVMEYKLAPLFASTQEERDYMINTFPKEAFAMALRATQAGDPLEDNLILKRILARPLHMQTAYGKKGAMVGTVINKLDTGGEISIEDSMNLKNAWLQGMEVEPKFFSKLMKYQLYINGGKFSPISFASSIPYQQKMSFKIPSDREESGEVSYTDYLKDRDEAPSVFNESMSQLDNPESDREFYAFIAQFFRNNWNQRKWVPSIKLSTKLLTQKSQKYYTFPFDSSLHIYTTQSNPLTHQTEIVFRPFVVINGKLFAINTKLSDGPMETVKDVYCYQLTSLGAGEQMIEYQKTYAFDSEPIQSVIKPHKAESQTPTLGTLSPTTTENLGEEEDGEEAETDETETSRTAEGFAPGSAENPISLAGLIPGSQPKGTADVGSMNTTQAEQSSTEGKLDKTNKDKQNLC